MEGINRGKTLFMMIIWIACFVSLFYFCFNIFLEENNPEVVIGIIVYGIIPIMIIIIGYLWLAFTK